jgi:hypothetical protein
MVIWKNINKIDKPLARLTKKKWRKFKFLKESEMSGKTLQWMLYK